MRSLQHHINSSYPILIRVCVERLGLTSENWKEQLEKGSRAALITKAQIHYHDILIMDGKSITPTNFTEITEYFIEHDLNEVEKEISKDIEDYLIEYKASQSFKYHDTHLIQVQF